ncbi:rod shape-determining protein MreD [Streptomyces oceani]|uniref:Rod shape-determining protein MreD n=1 Tax=Streptomyces oceani TaxID=1075402 RepID=A0A1E7KFQ3_9ACTN|nr:rod shape-determining protein MreD [Streptomyces oceani]OEV02748.1 rod shape-determining protein MreD [Streptomyces oceani]
MRANRILLSMALVVLALIVQVSVLARLQLPGAVPDLLLLTVLGLAMVYGHTPGALVGFAAGLLADIAPPADHAVGRYALVLCLVGYAAGLTKPEKGQHRSATVPMLVVASGAISSALLYAGVGALVGDSATGTSGFVGMLFTATLYDLLLAPFTVPLVMALARRTSRDLLAADAAGHGGGDGAYNGLTSGTGMRVSLRSGRGGKNGESAIGGQRNGLLGRPMRKADRIKGVKRL